ncbi:MAG: oligosaccharide flippase family protein [Bacteroidota bacterium]
MSEKLRSYRNTALIAVTSVINVVFSIIKNKVLALFIGPAGLGRFGMLSDTINFTGSIAQLGVANSGVQAIASVQSQGQEEVRRVYQSLLHFFSWVTLIVIGVVFFTAPYISGYLVGTTDLVWPLRIAILAIIFRIRSSIQGALITALQRINMLARANIYNGALVAAASIAMALLLGEDAVPYLVIIIPLVSWAISYYQVRLIMKEYPSVKGRIPYKQLQPILMIGLATLYSSMFETVVALISKVLIVRTFSETYLGYYQVSISITLSYISFITTSISNDYYPRLVLKLEEGIDAVNDFVNEQIGISMHLIMPILIFMLSFSELMIRILFSEKFMPANGIIGYSIIGTFLTVVSWPVAYTFLARRATRTYMITEFSGNASHLLLILGALYLRTFEWLGAAYFLHYVFYLTLISFFFLGKYGGRYTRQNIITFFSNVVILSLVVAAKHFLPVIISTAVSVVLIAAVLYMGRKEYRILFNSVTRKR